MDDIISPKHEEEDEPTDGVSRGLFCNIMEIDFLDHVIHGCILREFLCFVFCFVFVTTRMSFTFIMWCLQQSANKSTDPDALDDSTSPKHEEEDEP